MATDLFGQEIVENKIIDRALLESIFIESIKGISEESLVLMMYSKYEAILDFAKLCNGEKSGEKISMLFNPHRYSTPTKKSKSIIAAFHDDNFLSGLARATLFKEAKVKECLYQVLQLGINGIQYVNEFPPYISRDYCVGFSAKTVLDPCAGWGGRMIGVASVGGFYHGFEPSTKTYNGLIELGNFLKLFKTGFDFIVENKPFEDAILEKDYDLAITSPPYYDTERYSDEPTNSCNRYDSFDSWCSGFYIPMIEKTISHVKDFIINVGNRNYSLKSVLYNNFKNTEERTSRLSGSGGLGKTESGKESFYLVRR